MSIAFKPDDPRLKHLRLTIEVAPETSESYEVKVSDIIDGDTLEVDLTPGTPIKFSGSSQSTAIVQSVRLIERVRLLGIDSPETRPSDHADQQCRYLGIDIDLLFTLAKLSTLHLQYLCPKGTKLIVKTTSRTRDDYGHILAGLFVGDLCVNRAMVEHGYAMAYQGRSDGEKEYRDLEAQAKEAERGIWGHFEEAYYPASASLKAYHRPGCGSAPKAGTRFNTVREAKAKGFKACLACIPDFKQA